MNIKGPKERIVVCYIITKKAGSSKLCQWLGMLVFQEQDLEKLISALVTYSILSLNKNGNSHMSIFPFLKYMMHLK